MNERDSKLFSYALATTNEQRTIANHFFTSSGTPIAGGIATLEVEAALGARVFVNVALDGNDVVGVAYSSAPVDAMGDLASAGHPDAAAELSNLLQVLGQITVASGRRRQGVASTLIEVLVARLQRDTQVKAVLAMIEGEPEIVSFYESIGFTIAPVAADFAVPLDESDIVYGFTRSDDLRFAFLQF